MWNLKSKAEIIDWSQIDWSPKIKCMWKIKTLVNLDCLNQESKGWWIFGWRKSFFGFHLWSVFQYTHAVLRDDFTIMNFGTGVIFSWDNKLFSSEKSSQLLLMCSKHFYHSLPVKNLIRHNVKLITISSNVCKVVSLREWGNSRCTASSGSTAFCKQQSNPAGPKKLP